MFGFIFSFIVLTSTGTAQPNNLILSDYYAVEKYHRTTEKPLYVTAPNGAPYLIGKIISNGTQKYAVITRKMDFANPKKNSKGVIVGYPYKNNTKKIESVVGMTEPEIKLDMLLELGVSTRTINIGVK